MKKKILTMAIALMSIGLSSNVMAQFQTTNTEGTASAEIIAPISISTGDPMNFGQVQASSSTSGTVVLAPSIDNVTNRTGTNVLLMVSGTKGAPGTFTVTGETNFGYAITLPSDYTLTHSSGTGTMVINAFTSLPASADANIGPTGTQTILVGGTLNIASAQKSGVYTNSTGYTMIVQYN